MGPDGGGSGVGARLQGAVSFASKHRRKIGMGAAGGGIVGLLIAGFFALLPLKLEHLFKNIESKRFSLMQHAYDKRSEAWMRQYIVLESDPEARKKFFANSTFDPNHPFRSWYQGIRGSSFEADLAKNQGVIFRRDKPITDPTSRLVAISFGGEKHSVGDILNTYSTNKDARLAIRDAVKEQTKWYEILKRRHLRAWEMKHLGIKKWRIFEGTRDKADQFVRAKYAQYVLQPIYDNMGKWVECVISKDKGCPTTSDPNNTADGPRDSVPGEDHSGAGHDQNGIGQAIDDAGQSVSDQLSDPSSTAADQGARTVAQETSRAATSDEKGFVPSTVWEALFGEAFASKIAGAADIIGIVQVADTADHAHHVLKSNEAGKIVAIRNSLQYAAAFTGFAVMVDQIKKGETVSGEEVNATMQKFSGIENSQGYDDVFGSHNQGTPGYSSVDENHKINNANVDLVSKAYNASPVGIAADAIFSKYDDVRKFPVLKQVIDIASGLINKLTELAINFLEDTVKTLSGGVLDAKASMAWLMERLFSFLITPVIDGTEVGGKLFNAVDAGADVTANSYTKSVGGHLITGVSLKEEQLQIAQEDNYQYQRKSFWSKVASLNDDNSIASRLLLAFPSSTDDAIARMRGAVASLFDPSKTFLGLSQQLAYAASGPSFAAGEPDLYGVKQYGFTDNELDTNPLDPSMNSQNCQKQIQAWQQAQQSDNETVSDNAGSLCMLDQTFSQAALSMYTTADDGGLAAETTGQNAPTGPTNPAAPDRSQFFGDSSSFLCADGTTDVGVADGYTNGQRVPIRLCALTNLHSSGEESTPGSAYYVNGANGHCLVNARVASVAYAMINKAVAEHVPMGANSCFRTMAHQQALWDQFGHNPVRVARPGFSNHQMGLAIDFAGLPQSPGPVPSSPVWNWLSANAAIFGYYNYPAEAWHWSVTGN